MHFNDLDEDTKNIINTFCQLNNKTKEEAICGLVEIGMLTMMAAVSPNSIFNNVQKKRMQAGFDIINNDHNLKQTANVFNAFYTV